ncbi:hypothetical protein [Xanthomonas arboricola]|uniref:hypothetical protein n=1 Tax=Xanthomonas arboricola TaxID=56448 RepID=UPI0013E079FF|nr:hypothetical protein [Xanthomonas arboricola]
MNTEATMMNQKDLGSPKSLDELIAMAREVNAEFGKLHGYMSAILSEPQRQAA